MSRIASLLNAFAAAALVLCASAASAHGGAHPAPVDVEHGRGHLAALGISASQPLRAVIVVTAPAHCPGNEGSPCCCGLDRCTGGAEPLPLVARRADGFIGHACSAPHAARQNQAIDITGPPRAGALGPRAPPAAS
jgi:hypothetical protein